MDQEGGEEGASLTGAGSEEAEEEGSAHTLCPADTARLSLLDSLANLVLSRQMASLRDADFITPIISLLAFHACAGVEGGEGGLEGLGESLGLQALGASGEQGGC